MDAEAGVLGFLEEGEEGEVVLVRAVVEVDILRGEGEGEGLLSVFGKLLTWVCAWGSFEGLNEM